jgi:hypothetical protein
MFDWFWNFLYMISKTIFRLIDGLILCANKLCGISAISFDGEESDFLNYLIFSDSVSFAFKVSVLLATILLVAFTVFMIIRTIAKDKAEGTPAQIAIKAFKTLLMFFFIPLLLLAFMTIGNAFVKALYAATSQNTATPGAFLFSAFAEDGGMSSEIAARFRTGELDYYSTSAVNANMILSDFPFFSSYIAGGVVLFGIGSAMLIFVDRIISLVILYIASPFSIASSVLDDGARFKLWRDQFLSKFIMGYGMILAINIYAMVCGLAMNPNLVFFPGEDSSFLNLLMRLLIIGGGALTLQKAMALVGNLVASGAGSNELRDSMSAGALASMAGRTALKAATFAGKVGKGVLGLPFKPLNDIQKEKYHNWVRKKAAGASNDKSSKDDSKSSSGADNNESAKYGSKDNAKNAINGDGFKRSFGGGNTDNTNNNDMNNKKNTVGDAIKNNGNSLNKSNENNQNNQSNNPQQGEGGNK